MSKETERRNSSTNVCYTSPYEFTKTGLHGQQRVSMLRNELQILPEIGKPHRRGHKLPQSGFTYGIQVAERNGSVAEAMCYKSEKEHADNSDFKLVRDYAAFNKAALKAGMLTARDQSRFRTVHDVQKKSFRRDASRTKKTNAFSNDMVFGTTYKPSTPIAEVIQNHYAAKWFETIQDKRTSLRKGQSPKNTSKGKYHTKASLFRHVEIPVEPKPLRKMSDFVNVEHQVDSFRSEAERRKAVISTAYDSIPRQGTYHTGIYNVPRTTIKT